MKDREKMREEYNRQVAELEARVRKEVDQFITKNKESHEDSLGEMKKLREGYETRLKNMKENVRQRVEIGVVEIEKKHQMRYESSLKEL